MSTGAIVIRIDRLHSGVRRTAKNRGIVRAI